MSLAFCSEKTVFCSERGRFLVNHVEFGKVLRRLRKQSGLSEDALSDALYRYSSDANFGRSKAALSNLENGNRKTPIKHEQLLAFAHIFAEQLDPDSLQHWASYQDHWLKAKELEEVFGKRYTQAEYKHAANPCRLIARMIEKNMHILFNLRAVTIQLLYQELFFKVIGIFLKTKKIETSMYQKTVSELKKQVGLESCVTNYMLKRYHRLRQLLAETILFGVVFIVADAVVRDLWTSLMLVSLQLLWVMVIWYQCSWIVTPELIQTGQLE